MPITFADGTEAGSLDEVEQREGGRGLRRILEETLAASRDRDTQLATLMAEKAIGNGYSTVKPEDLAGVPVDQIEAKAKELHESNVAKEREVARKLLERQGLEGTALDEAVDKMVAGSTVENPATQFQGLQGIAGIGGEPAPAVDASKMVGVDKIALALQTGKTKGE